MLEFLTAFDLLLQNLTNWLSYTVIAIALALAVSQLVYFFTTRK